jgi:hypothetical protein
MICDKCGETLERSFGQWLHTRKGDILANLPYCAPKPITPDPDPHLWPPFKWPENA